ncbi:inhibitor of complement-mediated lysis [Streptococcus pyogenes]|uniref:hypothetical protein n=1 Tax=Streptococcus pyogenes TaxID=1314 RepID=UPI00109BEA13|nr:hypothetical protein [Streptococcus pyogenes]VGQ47320.1 inhibitor of complement-mediated lysis [Streptococcus pyogenes]
MKIKKNIKLSKRLLFTSLAAVALLGATQPVLADINPPYPELLDLGEPLDSGYYTDSSQEPPLLEPPYPGLLENDKDTSERGTSQSSGHDNGDNVHRPELPPLPESPWPENPRLPHRPGLPPVPESPWPDGPFSPFKPKKPSISETPRVDDYQRGFEDGRKAKSSPYGLDFSRLHESSTYSEQYKKGYMEGYLKG